MKENGRLDANQARDNEIKRLIELAALAFGNATNMRLRLNVRQTWHQKYTNTVLALNMLLKDLQYRDYEERLQILEQNWKPVRR